MQVGSWRYPKPLYRAKLVFSAGAIHGCALVVTFLAYMEDIGRHNAVDKIAGWMFLNIQPQDKVFYTTGRLTTEMVIKTVQMQIPVLVSRSGTAEAVDLARRAGLTLIGRAKGKRQHCLASNVLYLIPYDDDEFADALYHCNAPTGRPSGSQKRTGR